MKNLIICVSLLMLVSCSSNDDSAPRAEIVSAVNAQSSILSESMTLAEVLASGAAVINHENTYFAIGYRQVTANNQDPILLRFDDGSLTWAKTDYETSGDDGTGRGLILDPNTMQMHAVFTATGTQGSSQQDYRRYTSEGWQPTYGQGGGASVVVLLSIDPDTGTPQSGTYVVARLSNGNANTMRATGLNYTDGGIELQAASFFSPLNVDGNPLICNGSSPFSYRLLLELDLSNALSAEAENCE